jgi:sterol desaturase/sphingolipid hydroxylase (fatty acid hydroxylase superfamily)
MGSERNIFRPVLIVAFLVGCGLGGLALWAALQDNNQGEFLDPKTGALDWAQSSLVFLGWFLPVFILVTVAGAFMQWGYHRLRHWPRRPTRDHTP